MSQWHIFNLTCPNCGGKMQITSDIDRFSCGYCGNELIVHRGGSIVTVAPIVEGLKEVKVGVDKTASELAIARLTNEINALAQQRANATSSLPLGCSIMVGIMALVAGFFWILDTKDLAWLGFTFILILIAYGVYSYGKQSVLQKVKPIDALIAPKAQELQKHQAVVREK